MIQINQNIQKDAKDNGGDNRVALLESAFADLCWNRRVRKIREPDDVPTFLERINASKL